VLLDYGPAMDNVAIRLPRAVEELTPAWFTAALGHDVASADVEDIVWGTATKVLVRLSYGEGVPDTAPTAVCVKGGFDERLRGFDLDDAYELEAAFYGDVAPALDLPLPRCHYATFSAQEGQGIMVLDDLVASGCTFGDPVAPWTADQVAAALEVQAAWHRQTWGRSDGALGRLGLGSGPVRAAAAVLLGEEHWNGHFAQPDAPALPEELDDRERVARAFRALWAHDEQGVAALAHGDAHVGNTYIDADGSPAFLDWQAVCRAPSFYDVAYFVGGALEPEDRRAHERSLVDHYRQALAAGGGPVITADEAWSEYRRYTLHGFLWAVTPAVMQPLERVRAMAERHAAAIVEHDSLDALGA